MKKAVTLLAVSLIACLTTKAEIRAQESPVQEEEFQVGSPALGIRVLQHEIPPAGFDLPGSRVDIIIKIRDGKKVIAMPVVKNVLVLAMDARKRDPDSVLVITLAIPEKDWAKLERALDVGSPTLVLRQPAKK
jgi:Flp pilus assembly protein CpaB